MTECKGCSEDVEWHWHFCPECGMRTDFDEGL